MPSASAMVLRKQEKGIWTMDFIDLRDVNVPNYAQVAAEVLPYWLRGRFLVLKQHFGENELQ